MTILFFMFKFKICNVCVVLPQEALPFSTYFLFAYCEEMEEQLQAMKTLYYIYF